MAVVEDNVVDIGDDRVEEDVEVGEEVADEGAVLEVLGEADAEE